MLCKVQYSTKSLHLQGQFWTSMHAFYALGLETMIDTTKQRRAHVIIKQHSSPALTARESRMRRHALC
jgi:hypothetical protein